jgi:general secretion pathway protein L
MTHSLFIQLTQDTATNSSAPVNWALFDDESLRVDGACNAPLETLSESLNTVPTPQVIVLIPGQEVLQTNLQVPATQKRHLQRTLPFLVEEHIATPIEDMHLSASSLQGNVVSIFGISHARMKFWHALTKQHSISADAMWPDNLLGNLNPDELKIIIDNSEASFHYPQQPVINAPLSNLSFVADSFLSSLAEEPPQSATLVLAENLNQTASTTAQALATQLEVEGLSISTETTGNCFEYRCASVVNLIPSNQASKLPNLQSGAYQVTTERQRRNAPNWRAIAATITFSILLKLVFDVGTGLYLNYQTRQVDNQITSLYKELFPQDRKIIYSKVRVQMQGHLNQQGSALEANGFLTLFSHLAKALKNSDQAKVQQLRYNDQNQTLMLNIRVQKIKHLEQLKQGLANGNITAAILSANEEQQWVEGRIRLSL